MEKGMEKTFRLRLSYFSQSRYLFLIVLLIGCFGQACYKKNKPPAYSCEAGPLQIGKTLSDFGKIYRGSVCSDTIHILNRDSLPYEIRFSYDESLLHAQAIPQCLPPGGAGLIVITLDTRTVTEGYAPVWDKIRCSGRHGSQPSWMILVKAEIKDDFRQLTDTEKKEAAIAAFNPAKYDFGEIKSGEKVHWDVTVRNEGVRDLIIRHVKTTCGCTATSLSARTIPAGETATLSITFRTHGRRGQQHKTITVYTNDWRHPETELHLEGMIK